MNDEPAECINSPSKLKTQSTTVKSPHDGCSFPDEIFRKRAAQPTGILRRFGEVLVEKEDMDGAAAAGRVIIRADAGEADTVPSQVLRLAGFVDALRRSA